MFIHYINYFRLRNNRNILECKSKKIEEKKLEKPGNNRNILECKFAKEVLAGQWGNGK